MPKRSIARWRCELTRTLALGGALVALITQTARAQNPPPYITALQSWIALPASPGYEQVAVDRILSFTRGWRRDAMGNLVKRVGSGTPRRVIACGIDEVGYVVSAITDSGYLRVHAAGNGPRHPLWDQFHEGQRIYVVAHGGSGTGGDRVRYVPGVFAVRSTHLWRRRGAEEAPASIENLWIDVGARSRTDVARLGIRLLDPVFREWPGWTFADYVAGPGAANRAGCAAVAAAAQAGVPKTGQTTFVISVQSRFNFTGLTAVLATLGEVDTLAVVNDSLARLAGAAGAPGARRGAFPWSALSRVRVANTVALAPRVRYPETLVETLRENEIADIHARVARLAGLGAGALPAPVRLARPWSAPPPSVSRDSLSRYADLLSRLTDVYSVAGHEEPMRDAVRDALPAWARSRAQVDTAGNLVLALGPNRDTVLFVAHMDEVGFQVTRIAKDGTVSLRTRGGFFPSLWEGQTALLHRPNENPGSRDAWGCGAAREGPLRGVFMPRDRDSVSQRQPQQVAAWFGLDSAALVAAHGGAGLSVTSYKCSSRLAGSRFTARSIDDRAGSTALLLALDAIDTLRLTHKVIFAWSVREEGGLEGAHALAQNYGPSIQRVYAIDTFVSSDSPLESDRFAYAPIGEGAVARALDNASVTTPDELDRVVRIARIARIPIQVGTTNGGTDGSELGRYGALVVPVGWPLRYSHSPAEVIDVRDIRSLTRLVVELANAPTPKP